MKRYTYEVATNVRSIELQEKINFYSNMGYRMISCSYMGDYSFTLIFEREINDNMILS